LLIYWLLFMINMLVAAVLLGAVMCDSLFDQYHSSQSHRLTSAASLIICL
jgi:hypothetical protein